MAVVRNQRVEHEGYFQLGLITRAHGVKGNVVIRLDVDHPESYKKLKEVHLDQDGLLRPFKITTLTFSGDQIIVHLEGVEDMTMAEALVKSPVFLPVTSLPRLTGNQLYLHEAVGMRVIDATEGELGIIEKIYELPEQPVAAVIYGGKELLFPLISVFIQKVDRLNNTLYTNLPEGLVDIYR